MTQTASGISASDPGRRAPGRRDRHADTARHPKRAPARSARPSWPAGEGPAAAGHSLPPGFVELLVLGQPDLGVEEARQRHDPRLGHPPEPPQMRALAARPLVRRQGRATGRLGSRRRRAQRLGVGGAEPLRPHAVDDDRLESGADRVRQPALGSSVSLMGIPRAARPRRTRSAQGPRARRGSGTPGAGSAPRARSRRTPAAWSASPGRGRRTARRRSRGSYVRLTPSTAALWPSSQILPIVISSFAPGAAATKYWNADERASMRSPMPPIWLRATPRAPAAGRS